MSRCPTCKRELEHERIGGTGRNAGRLVLLCARCWVVFAFDQRPRLHLVDDDRERRDLA